MIAPAESRTFVQSLVRQDNTENAVRLDRAPFGFYQWSLGGGSSEPAGPGAWNEAKRLYDVESADVVPRFVGDEEGREKCARDR